MYSNHENFPFSSTIQYIITKNKIADDKEMKIHEGVPLILLIAKKFFKYRPPKNIIIPMPERKIQRLLIFDLPSNLLISSETIIHPKVNA